MNMTIYKKTLNTAMVVALILLFSPTMSLGWQGNPNIRGPYCSQERQQAVHKAIEEGDYSSWRALMERGPGRKRVLAVVNETNFPQFALAYRLAKDGRFDEADKIRSQLGLPPAYRGKALPYGYGRGRNRSGGWGLGY